jgi:RND superfamily putative drug exporter
VLFAVATALTLLPALLTLLGNRIDAGRAVGRNRPVKQAEDTAGGATPPRLAEARGRT